MARFLIALVLATSAVVLTAFSVLAEGGPGCCFR